MSRYSILLYILFLVGCASSGIVITQNNNLIKTPHYSIEIPPSQGWVLKAEDTTQYPVSLTKSIDVIACQMYFSINWVASEHMKAWTAKQVADDYRIGELSDMKRKGVMTGMYQLEDVVMGEQVIGDKKFYTMDYANIRENYKEKSSLYLYFPKETDIGVFIIAIYTEGYVGDEVLSRSYKPEFVKALESLQLTNDAAP